MIYTITAPKSQNGTNHISLITEDQSLAPLCKSKSAQRLTAWSEAEEVADAGRPLAEVFSDFRNLHFQCKGCLKQAFATHR